jgi:hypothetical protein
MKERANAMDKASAKTRVERRDFLRGVATGSLLIAAAVAAGAPRRAQAKPETREDRRKARYKETAHVKRYYETNRY